MANPGLDSNVVAQIQAHIMDGWKPAAIAAELGVSYSSVIRAKNKMPEDVLEKMSSEQINVVSDLIMVQLESGIEASIAIAEQAKNEEWRTSQNASQLATLYGVVTDKSIRLLEASENAARAQADSRAAGVIDESDHSN